MCQALWWRYGNRGEGAGGARSGGRPCGVRTLHDRTRDKGSAQPGSPGSRPPPLGDAGPPRPPAPHIAPTFAGRTGGSSASERFCNRLPTSACGLRSPALPPPPLPSSFLPSPADFPPQPSPAAAPPLPGRLPCFHLPCSLLPSPLFPSLRRPGDLPTELEEPAGPRLLPGPLASPPHSAGCSGRPQTTPLGIPAPRDPAAPSLTTPSGFRGVLGPRPSQAQLPRPRPWRVSPRPLRPRPPRPRPRAPAGSQATPLITPLRVPVAARPPSAPPCSAPRASLPRDRGPRPPGAGRGGLAVPAAPPATGSGPRPASCSRGPENAAPPAEGARHAAPRKTKLLSARRVPSRPRNWVNQASCF
uniref:basic proline-rich protein-like n=1 Tax=Panthera onca TaxID=9690 RepID=UPI0029555735|nr:basic proline-rich protein-like [Panthera onca]